MTRFYLAPDQFDKWVYQNEGEYATCVEGVLQDSVVVAAKRGWAMIYEHYVNKWTSNFYVEFAPYKNKSEVDELWKNWYAFEEKLVYER